MSAFQHVSPSNTLAAASTPLRKREGKEWVKGSQSRLEMFGKLRLPGFLQFTATLRE
jgi:hypothetical protein